MWFWSLFIHCCPHCHHHPLLLRLQLLLRPCLLPFPLPLLLPLLLLPTFLIVLLLLLLLLQSVGPSHLSAAHPPLHLSLHLLWRTRPWLTFLISLPLLPLLLLIWLSHNNNIYNNNNFFYSKCGYNNSNSIRPNNKIHPIILLSNPVLLFFFQQLHPLHLFLLRLLIFLPLDILLFRNHPWWAQYPFLFLSPTFLFHGKLCLCLLIWFLFHPFLLLLLLFSRVLLLIQPPATLFFSSSNKCRCTRTRNNNSNKHLSLCIMFLLNNCNRCTHKHRHSFTTVIPILETTLWFWWSSLSLLHSAFVLSFAFSPSIGRHCSSASFFSLSSTKLSQISALHFLTIVRFVVCFLDFVLHGSIIYCFVTTCSGWCIEKEQHQSSVGSSKR